MKIVSHHGYCPKKRCQRSINIGYSLDKSLDGTSIYEKTSNLCDDCETCHDNCEAYVDADNTLDF
jgi:hypothetical protein